MRMWKNTNLCPQKLVVGCWGDSEGSRLLSAWNLEVWARDLQAGYGHRTWSGADGGPMAGLSLWGVCGCPETGDSRLWVSSLEYLPRLSSSFV